MTDYYKILSVSAGATETEIKKRFRKLATIHHPDKNAGSKKSEETFKIILNAYETLSDKESRAAYDFKYKQFYQQTKTDASSQNTYTKSKTQYRQQQESPQYKYPPNTEYKNQETTKSKINYTFWIIALAIVLIYFFSSKTTTTTTTGNAKADKQLEEQQTENRPQSGEIDFKK